jgi:hypothetical protein
VLTIDLLSKKLFYPEFPMTSKFLTIFTLSLSIVCQPLVSSVARAQAIPQDVQDVKVMSPSELATALRAMPADKRKALLDSYQSYLGRLDSALARAQADSERNGLENGANAEVRMLKTGLALTAAGEIIFIAGMVLSDLKSSYPVLKSIAAIGLRGGAISGFGGAFLMIVGCLTGITKIELNNIQISKIRTSIQRIQAQIVLIQALTNN